MEYPGFISRSLTYIIDLVVFGMLVVFAIRFIVSVKRKKNAKQARMTALYYKRMDVLRGLTRTARIAGDEGHADKVVIESFKAHETLSRQLCFGHDSLCYIDEFQAKLERLKRLDELDQTSETDAERCELKVWFWTQEREALRRLGPDIGIEVAPGPLKNPNPDDDARAD